MDRLRRAAWLLIVVADAGILLWGAMAALAPEHLLGLLPPQSRRMKRQ